MTGFPLLTLKKGNWHEYQNSVRVNFIFKAQPGKHYPSMEPAASPEGAHVHAFVRELS